MHTAITLRECSAVCYRVIRVENSGWGMVPPEGLFVSALTPTRFPERLSVDLTPSEFRDLKDRWFKAIDTSRPSRELSIPSVVVRWHGSEVPPG